MGKRCTSTDIVRHRPRSSASSWECDVCAYENQHAHKCQMCGTEKQEHQEAAQDLNLSLMLGNLSIVQSPIPENKEVDDTSVCWDLCLDADPLVSRQSVPEEKSKKKNAAKARQTSILNTSTSTLTW